MARNPYKSQKRRRELERQKKQESKRQRRQNKAEQSAEETDTESGEDRTPESTQRKAIFFMATTSDPQDNSFIERKDTPQRQPYANSNVTRFSHLRREMMASKGRERA